jgi:hypothetical protein
MESTLTRIQNWYKLNCNGDWEHSYGMKISNLDNPGWDIKIDIQDTALENLDYKKEFQNPNNEFDWYFISSTESTLNMSCGIDNFEQILKIFLDEIIPKHSNTEYYYDVYLPLSGYKFDILTPAKGKVINEKTIQLTEVLPVEYKNIKVLDLDLIDFDQTDLDKLKLNYEIGDEISVDLTEVFDGLVLTEKKK